MFKVLYRCNRTIERHINSPLADSRRRYLEHLAPIEKAWAKLKEILRTAQARTRETLELAIADALKRITPDNARAWFRLCNSVYVIS